MEQPLVSVIVVSYNHSKYIRENLDSIKAQTYPNIELIVADDASKDNSVEVFEAWLSENNYSAKKNFHKQNTGLATTLNECLEMVSGKYVKIIAADDYLHPESIEKCVEKLEELGEDYGMIFTDYFTVDDKSNIVEKYLVNDSNILDNNTLKYEALLERNRIIAPTTLVRVNIIRETGKYTPNFILEDHDRWLRIGKISKIYYIDECLCYYRRHEGNLSQIRHRQMFFEDLYLKMKYDEDGSMQTFVNKNIGQIFLERQEEIPKFVKNAYQKYSYRGKMLSLCIKYNLNKLYKFYFNTIY